MYKRFYKTLECGMSNQFYTFTRTSSVNTTKLKPTIPFTSRTIRGVRAIIITHSCVMITIIHIWNRKESYRKLNNVNVRILIQVKLVYDQTFSYYIPCGLSVFIPKHHHTQNYIQTTFDATYLAIFLRLILPFIKHTRII